MRFINDKFKRRDGHKDELINRIIDMEWSMFDQVVNMGGRAPCQDDEWTFYVMRFSQFAAFDDATLQSYEQDLLEIQAAGRNIITEKYGYMMEYTDQVYFDREIKSALPQISSAKNAMVDCIVNKLMDFEKVFAERYPILGSRSRPLQGTKTGGVSFHIYTIGELKTYSLRTLELYYRHIAGIDPADELHNSSFVIHRIMTRFYGYGSMDDAEARILRKR